MRGMATQPRARRARDEVSRAARRPAAARRTTRGSWRHGAMPKIALISVTSIVTIGAAAWALLPGAADAPAPPAKVVILGDSYTVGVGGDGTAWPSTVATELGWEVVNLAAGGTGYATDAGMAGCGREHCGDYLEQSKAIAEAPDVIITAGGRNDSSKLIGAAALKLFTSLHERFPKAKIIAISPWADDDPPTAGLTESTTALRAAAEKAGVDYVDSGQPFVGHPELISADGIHPNAAGYARLSAVLAPLLAKATGHVPVTVDPDASVTQRQVQVREALRAKQWPQLTPARLGQEALASEWVTDDCADVSAETADDCAYGPEEPTGLVALLGDEHAISYMPALRAAFPDRRIQSLTMRACPAAPVEMIVDADDTTAACAAHRTWATGWVETHTPQTIFVVDAWDTTSRMTGDDDVAKLRGYKSALTGLVRRLAAEDARVVVLASPPPGADLSKCRTATSSPTVCVRTMPRSYSDWAKAAGDAVTQSTIADALFVRTDRWFCATGSCPAFVAGAFTLADGSHLTEQASRALAPLLVHALSST